MIPPEFAVWQDFVLERESVKFSIGDLVTERKSNLWYLTQETSYEYFPHLPHSMSEYWTDYVNKREAAALSIGIIIDIHDNEPNSYFVDRYYTYEVLWTNMPDNTFRTMSHKLFLEDELRLLSKINRGKQS